MRPDWDQYFYQLAAAVATRGTCPRLAVGCVIVRAKRIVCTGYNGAVSSESHCVDVGCKIENGHCRSAVHAEANALLQAARHGLSVENCVAYVTHKPCPYCAMLLQNAGIVEVKYSHEY